MNYFAAYHAIIFVDKCADCENLTQILQKQGFNAVGLHGQLPQTHRLGALNKFKAENGANVLIATDVASRGLDIPACDLVVNFDLPKASKDYIHRVGRTARAGKKGTACTFMEESDRKLIKAVSKRGSKLVARAVPQLHEEAQRRLQRQQLQLPRELLLLRRRRLRLLLVAPRRPQLCSHLRTLPA